jgi:hypothetical protein
MAQEEHINLEPMNPPQAAPATAPAQAPAGQWVPVMHNGW